MHRPRLGMTTTPRRWKWRWMMGDDTVNDDEWEETLPFGHCTCEHEMHEHGSSDCGVVNCPCEGGWER